MSDNNNDSWAVAELMGHVTLAGRITKPGEYGGLWQIDIPEGDSFRTEFFGSQAVYRIRIVSEEIARAYARPGHEVIAYDAPIITREEHLQVVEKAGEKIRDLQTRLHEAEMKLLALPAGQERDYEQPDDDGIFDEDPDDEEGKDDEL